MKIKKGTAGFWATVSIAIAAVGCMLSVTYFNPSKSVTGLLMTLVIVLVWMFVANLIINFLSKEENSGKAEENEVKETYASSEAVDTEDDLTMEFHRLVSDIARHNARAAGKLLTYAEADSKNCPEEKLISPDDMEKAFWEAANLVSRKCGQSCVSCGNDCDKQTLLQKIKNLRKKYEEESKTP